MSDSEDDYMSDKFLKACENADQDVRPGLVHNRTTKRQYELEKKRKEEEESKRRKSRKELEEEQREKGLSTAISSDNKGFKLLAKMGFNPGQGLGKTNSGRIEPIAVNVKADKMGLGRENHLKRKYVKQIAAGQDNLQKKMDTFLEVRKHKLSEQFLYRDISKAQRVCEVLDLKNDVNEPLAEYFWTKDTIKTRRKITEEEQEEFDEEFSSYIEDGNLVDIINYLRGRHLYCMYCAFVATDEEDLKNSCPGPYRIDHED